MSNHDPKCHAYGFGPGQRMDICICTGIRIGRADERAKVIAEHNAILPATLAAEIDSATTLLRAKVGAWFYGAYETARERHAHDPDHRHYWEGFRDALDKAEQDVLALFPKEKP